MTTPGEPANYLIVRFRATGRNSLNFTNYRIRKVIHDEAERLGLDVADVPVLHDRPETIFGTPAPYAEAQELFSKLMPPRRNDGGY